MGTRTCPILTGAQSSLSLLILLGLHVPAARLSAAQSDATPPPIVGPGPSMPKEVYVPRPPGVRVEVVATNLDVVWSLEFASDGRLFLTEKAGRIRVIGPDGRLDPVPWKALERVHSWGEAGLMGLALHPDFPREPWVYVMYTTLKDGRPVNRVARIREASGRGAREEVLLDDIPAAERTNHNGGRIRFGPDGMLWIGTGDAYEPGRAQDLSSPSGGVLRLTPAGDVPADNPWPVNPRWAYGLRNVQALAWHPSTGALFAGDHGPTSEWRSAGITHRDEINIIERGRNYGWPLAVGAPGADGLEDPILAFIPSAPPADLIFYTAGLIPELTGDLFLGSLRAETLMRIRFQDPSDPHRVTAVERWFNTGPRGQSVHGRIRSLAVGPEGALYLGTGNRFRGRTREGDDRILRIVPARRPDPTR